MGCSRRGAPGGTLPGSCAHSSFHVRTATSMTTAAGCRPIMTDRSFVRERSCCCQFDDPLGSPLAFDHPGSERLAALVSRRPAHSVRGTLAALLTLRVAVLSSSGMDRTLGPFHSRPCLVVLPRYVGGAGRGRTLGEPGRCKHRSGLCGERGAQQVPGAERAGASLPSLNTACSSFLTH